MTHPRGGAVNRVRLTAAEERLLFGGRAGDYLRDILKPAAEAIKTSAVQLHNLQSNEADEAKARPWWDGLTLTIFGAPRTKKTHSRIFRAGRTGRPRIMPSAAHEAWYAVASAAVVHWRTANRVATITDPVNVRALFYREALTGDTCGYYQALADLLERTGVLENDRLIASWDGSRLLKSKENPRIEVMIEPADSAVIPPRRKR